MYRIYAAKSVGNLNLDTLTPVRCVQRDQTAKQCTRLFLEGYVIHKVVLPSGKELPRRDIERALKTGIKAITAALENKTRHDYASAF